MATVDCPISDPVSLTSKSSCVEIHIFLLIPLLQRALVYKLGPLQDSRVPGVVLKDGTQDSLVLGPKAKCR